MKRVFIFIYSNLICSCLSCNHPINKHIDDPVIIDINKALNSKINFHFSDFVDSISYIPIENDQNNFIASPIQPIEMTQNYIILYDGLDRLLSYSRKDQSIRQIAKKGKGPGEHNGIHEFVADEQNNVIYVLNNSASANTILKYSFEGQFLGKISLDENADNIGLTQDGLLVIHFTNWTGKAKNQYIVMNNNGKTITTYPNPFPYQLSRHRTILLFETVKYVYNNNFHIKDKSDTLYVFKGAKRYPKYVFKNINSIDNKKSLSPTEYDEAINFWYIFETETRLQFAFPYRKKIHHCYYDKINGQLHSTDVRDIPNNIVDHYPYSSHFDRQFNNVIIKGRWGSEGQRVKGIDEESFFLVLLHLKQ